MLMDFLKGIDIVKSDLGLPTLAGLDMLSYLFKITPVCGSYLPAG